MITNPQEKFTTNADYIEATKLFTAFYDAITSTCDYDHDSAMSAASSAVKEITGIQSMGRLVAGYDV